MKVSKESYRTKFPIYSHRGDEILPPGILLDEDTLESLRARPYDRSLVPLGASGMVRRDVENFLPNPPYDAIFRDRASLDYVYGMMDRVKIPKGAFEVIEYFREKDFYTYRHMLAVFAISTRLAAHLHSTGDYDESMIASPVHDLGKCSIPLAILLKETPLTAQERKHIEHHTLAGYALVHFFSQGQGTELASLVARDHHERQDGSGYPSGTRNMDKRIEIIVVSDMYDALVSVRPYRVAPFDGRSALDNLSDKAAEGKVSPDIVQALIACSRKSGATWKDCKIPAERRGKPPVGNNYGLIAEEPLLD